jgi:hypothetical protein
LDTEIATNKVVLASESRTVPNSHQHKRSTASSSSSAVSDYWSGGTGGDDEEVEEVVFSRDALKTTEPSATKTQTLVKDSIESNGVSVSSPSKWSALFGDAMKAAGDRAADMFTPEQALQLGEV